MRDTLSTGRIAQVCDVSVVTVCNWIDQNRLRGHRIPGSSHRRVYISDLQAFLRDRGMTKALEKLQRETQ